MTRPWLIACALLPLLWMPGCGEPEPSAPAVDAGGGGPVFGDVADAGGPVPSSCAAVDDCAPWSRVCDTAAGKCVDCLDNGHCAGGEACQGRVCLPSSCEAGQRLCKSLRVAAACKGDGSGFKVTDCTTSQTCVDGVCKTMLCVPDSVVCNGAGSARLVCNGRGDAQAAKPCPGGSVCVAGACKTLVCGAGKTDCKNGHVLTCADDGSQWKVTPCGDKESCDPGYGSGGEASCKGWACTPGDGFCVDGKAMKCADDGLSAGMAANCNDLDAAGKPQVCLAGKCLSVKCQPGTFVCLGWTSLGKCASDGQSWQKTSCGKDFVCEGSKCVPAVCIAGKGYCEDGKAMLCNALGSKGQFIEDCKIQALDCAAGKCGLIKCIPGIAVCSKDKSKLLVCDEFGQKQLEQPCQKGQFCVGKKCVTAVCAPGAKQCKDGKPLDCNGDGTAWIPQPECIAGSACSEGVCKKQDCKPGAKKCDGPGAVLVCNKNGVGYSPQSCPAGQVCMDAACKAQLCTPGSSWCDKAVAKTCDVTGLAIANTVDCGKAGKSCKGGICVEKGCGDGECTKSIGETCTSCAKDCGACPPDGCKALPAAGCQGCACEKCVCDFDGTCCSQSWSGLCATLCQTACTNTCK